MLTDAEESFQRAPPNDNLYAVTGQCSWNKLDTVRAVGE